MYYQVVLHVLLVIVLSDGRNLQASHRTKRSENIRFDENNSYHWMLEAQWLLNKKVFASLNKNVAKNVIFFLGDGMSLSTMAAARVYMGQKNGYVGEETKLSFENFPFSGLAKTYCVDSQVADSACSATAYLCGVKANKGTIGLSGAARRGVCATQLQPAHAVPSVLAWAQASGKTTGIVTTTRITHATPAATYANVADRLWENDAAVAKKTKQGCKDIADQLVSGLTGRNLRVIFGGGRKNLLPKTSEDPDGLPGERLDGRDLIKEWESAHDDDFNRSTVVYNKEDLMDIDASKIDYVLGLFSNDHMPFHLEADKEKVPSLTNMTVKAIEILQKNEDGYFLFVEAGTIDIAHHMTLAQKALDETAELSNAVQAALDMVDTRDTLVLVSADHGHTMSYGGLTPRGNDILGFAPNAALDGKPYTTLNYANGPGFSFHFASGSRRNVTRDNYSGLNYTYPALAPLERETHGGEDVVVYAKGPWAHLFSGNYEQSFIPHAIGFAACIGERLSACPVL